MRKKVIIKRRENTTNLPDHIYDSAKKRIGSTFKANGDINTGLTLEETKKLMPEIIAMAPTDPMFSKSVKEYFMNFTVEVPTEGLELEVGVDKDGTPYEVYDYLKYKFAIQHPYLLLDDADSEEKKKKRRYMFVLEDKNKKKAMKVLAKNARKEALTEYIKLTSNKTKMSQVLDIYGENSPSLDDDDREVLLEKFANEDPNKFLKIVKDDKLETRSFVKNCLTHEVLRKVGNSVLDGEEVLGNDEEEAVLFLLDKKNSDKLITLKQRLKELTKAK